MVTGCWWIEEGVRGFHLVTTLHMHTSPMYAHAISIALCASQQQPGNSQAQTGSSSPLSLSLYRHTTPNKLKLTVDLADVTAALHAQPDVHEAPALLAQQQQGLKHLGAKGLGLDQLKGDACSEGFEGA